MQQIQCGMLDEPFGTFSIDSNGNIQLDGDKLTLGQVLKTYKQGDETEAQTIEALPTRMRNWYWAKEVTPDSEVKFNPYHDRLGRFGTGGLGGERPTTGESIDAPHVSTGHDKVALTVYMGKHGVTFEQAVSDGSALVEQSQRHGSFTDDADWYNRAAEASNALAVRHHLTPEQSSGVIAAMSPRSAWDGVNADAQIIKPNLKDAITIIKMHEANPTVTISDVMAEKLAKYDGKTGFSQLIGTSKPFSDYTPVQQSFLLSPVVRGFPLNTAKALRILQGESVDSVLGGPKVRSFYNNIRHPDHSNSVTVDTWMAKVLSGKDIPVEQALKILNGFHAGVFKKMGAYPFYVDVITEIAKKYHLLPHEAQAVMWVQGRKNAGGQYHG